MKKAERNFILITGGANGIGLSITKKFYNNGDNLIVIDKDIIGLSKLKQQVSRGKNSIIVEKVDLSSDKEISKFLLKLKKENIVIQHLINNAGYQENVGIFNLKLNQWRKLFRVNLEACLLLSQFVAKQMVKNRITGSIINITSIHCKIIRDMAHYSSAKAALEMLTKELAYKLAEYNIRVNAVAPGAINTSLIRQDLKNKKLLQSAVKQIPLGALGKPDDVANVVEFLISDKANYITGTTIIVDGGLSLVI